MYRAFLYWTKEKKIVPNKSNDDGKNSWGGKRLTDIQPAEERGTFSAGVL